jgi:hypothetical protein
MNLELKPVSMRHVYEVGDEFGYNYTIHAAKDDEFGSWSASVTVSDWGQSTPEAAVEALVPALRHLLQKIVGDPQS